MKANTLRKLYLDFFRAKKHKIVASSPIVVKNDPTLMFANAGMNQFKAIFLGESVPKDLRIANSQKCLRVSGKHNDLEEVGHDTYHHTMFEMLGSWSFGDYFKEEAIAWAWEFLIDVCKMDPDRFYVTVFEGEAIDNLEKDSESFDFWKQHLPEDRILNGNKHDNFWEMGETGPCGPCSEIHFDNRDDLERSKIDGKLLVNQDHPQVIEIWNLVFMQYNRFSNGELKTLPNSHVDTGMGLERLAMILQGKKSNYDTDIFQPIIQMIAKEAAVNYGDNEEKDIAMRVISDHIRAITFSIADGQLPSNIKGGYVIRRILRRAIRYAYTFLGLKDVFMYKLVSVLINQMGGQFKELQDQQLLIEKIIKEEESSFLRTLSSGLKRIDEITRNANGIISGKQVFELYDTYGFPVDLTALILNEQNLSFDQKEFSSAMQEQKNRSKKAGKLEKGDWEVLIKDEIEEFVGYKNLTTEVLITRYRKVTSKDGVHYQLVFNITPFYAEGGGQVGDVGVIENQSESIIISDTKKENNLIVHFTDSLPNDLKSPFVAKVDICKRKSSSRNHTATHLLHESLRSILGEHVVQKGSLVCPSYFRFDFSHFQKIEQFELEKIEKDVNTKILSNILLDEHNNLPLSKAKQIGAIMLFGEQYGDVVRMIQFDSSKELCGGTHVNSTGEIGLFKIISEGSVSSGVRRIEAKTGAYALEYLNDQVSLLKELKLIVKHKDLKIGLEQLVTSKSNLEKQINDLKKSQILSFKKDILDAVVEIKGVRFVAKNTDLTVEDMKNLSFHFRQENNFMLVLASKKADKTFLSIMLTDDLIAKGMDAVVMIREIAKEIDGGGGGQPFFATAGGSNIKGLSNALAIAKKLVK